MSASDLVAAERAAMLDLMEKLGPSAPTLCEGWTTEDLAAHLVAREHRIDSAPGLVIPPLAGWTDKVREGEKAKGYDALLARLRGGPPLWFRGPVANLNVGEHFIHHEDVRRANGETTSRELGADLEAMLWKGLAMSGRIASRKLKRIRLELRTPDGRSRTFGDGEPVAIVGPTGDIVLFLAGRKDAANVTLEGEPAAVERVRAAHLGI
jgi:uncharacterized protein (TIGR03085 family)